VAKSAKKSARRYCKICKKKTRHIKALFSLPFDCGNPHPNDNIRCVICKRPFSEEVIKLAKGIGATVRYCHRCGPEPIDTPDWLRICIRKGDIRHHGE